MHPFLSILAIAVLAALCGIDSFAGMATFANYKIDWLKTFLDLPNGAPSHDTFNRIFARVKPDKFQTCFAEWMKAVVELLEGEVVAIDGKTLRRSFDRRSSKAPIHMVSAWATANGVALGQVKVDEKSNEITAIPNLLDMLCLKGCIVTIDAIGCQRAICEKILVEGADYTIALKANQGTLFEDVKAVFDRYGFDDQRRMAHRTTSNHGHGRDEERFVLVSDEIADLKAKHDWPGLKSVGIIQNLRTIGGVTTNEFRYFINSYRPSAQKFMDVVRSHWQVENALHWTLDVVYDDDLSRVRKDHGAENLSTLRRIAINMLRKDPWKQSLPQKQIRAAHDLGYLFKLLTSL